MIQLQQEQGASKALSPPARSLMVCYDEGEWSELPGVVQVPGLESRQIAHAGITWAGVPVESFRNEGLGSFFMVCLSGRASLSFGSGWQRFEVGMACLLPRSGPPGFQVVDRQEGVYAFVQYREGGREVPVAPGRLAQVGAYAGEGIALALKGLYEESSGLAEGASLHHWVELIHGYVSRFAPAQDLDDRVWRAWETVAASLDRDWCLGEIAHEAAMSVEHFRRLCLKAFGVSPMKRLMELRMERASKLLVSSDLKVEAVAAEVGYGFASCFSNAFQKWSGLRPSVYRRSRGRAL